MVESHLPCGRFYLTRFGAGAMKVKAKRKSEIFENQ